MRSVGSDSLFCKSSLADAVSLYEFITNKLLELRVRLFFKVKINVGFHNRKHNFLKACFKTTIFFLVLFFYAIYNLSQNITLSETSLT